MVFLKISDESVCFNFDDFVISSGRPTQQELGGIPTFLYGCISPHESDMFTSRSTSGYISLSSEARREAVEKGYTPIFEGCNSKFTIELIKNPPAFNLGQIPVFGLFPSHSGLREKLEKPIRLSKIIDILRVNEYVEKILAEVTYVNYVSRDIPLPSLASHSSVLQNFQNPSYFLIPLI